MKKLMRIVLLIGTLFFGMSVSANAATITTSITGTNTIEAGKEFTIKVSVKSSTAVWALEGNLEYDKTKIQYVSSSGLNGYTLTYGTRFALDTVSPKTSSQVMSFTFKALSNFKAGESTTISIKNATGVVDGNDSDVSASNASFKVSVAKPKSTNNNLKTLTVDGTSVKGFKSSTLTYNLGTVEKDKIKIAATVADTKAKVSGTGTKTLQYGKNTFSIKVTAENGTTKTYKITVTKKDDRENVNTLSSLSVKDYTLDFNKNTLDYTINVAKDVEEIEISAEATSSKASVKGTGTKELKDGSNIFEVTVTAENKSKKVYKITVIKESDEELSNDASIKSVTLDGNSITLNKDLPTLLTVANDVEILPLEITPSDESTVVSIEGKELNVGSNTVRVTLTAQDGTKEEYLLYVVRRDELEYYQDLDDINTSSYHFLLTNNTNDAFLVSKLRQTEELVSIEYLDDAGNSIQTIKLIGRNLPYDITELFTTLSNESLKEHFTSYQAFDVKYEGDVVYTMYVGDMGQISTLYLYTYDENNKITSKQELNVENGFITFENEGIKSYALSKENIEVKEEFKLTIDWKDIVILIETLIIIIGSIFSYKKIKELKANQKKTRKTTKK